MEKKIYEIAIKQLRELFPKWFERLLQRREQLGIKEKRPLRKYGFESARNISLETELETDCNSFIYDYCFSNKERFRLFSKQFSSKEKFAESIVLQALNKIFYEANAYLNQFEISKNRAEREKNLLHRHIDEIITSDIVDKRKSKLKAEDCIKEYFETEKFDTLLTNKELAPIIINWAVKKGYKKFRENTIRPKISKFRNLSE